MRYIEGFHGIFRDNGYKPSVEELAHYRNEFYKENPDVPRIEQNQFISAAAIIIGFIVFIIGMVMKNDNLPMIGLSGGFLYNALKYIILYTKGRYPKPEKSKLILPMVILGPSLIIFVYNVLRIFNVIPVSKLGNDILVGSVLAWVGAVTLLMQLFYALKMNIRCRAKTDGVLIGYSDFETTASSGSRRVRRVVGSRYVYGFEVDGEEYAVVTPSGQTNYLFLRPLGSSHVIKYDPNNPEFCMAKHFEISSIIIGLVVGLICGWFAFNQFNTIVKYDLDDPYGENVPTMPAIIVVDDNGVVSGIDEYESLHPTETTEETVMNETSETSAPTPTPVPLYSDEWITEVCGTDDYVCYVYPVDSIEGDKVYMGTVPGLYSRYITIEDCDVGDEILFVNLRGAYLYYKLNEDESYTGTHTPENMGWIAEDGRIIFSEDYVKIHYGDGYEICTYYVQGKEGNDYMIGCDDYYYLFGENNIEDFSHWNMEMGHVYYAASNNQAVFLVDSDLYILP